MRTAIIYMSKHGTTENLAFTIAQKLNKGEVELLNLKKDKLPPLELFDRIVIGGSIHAGSIQKGVRRLCKKHLPLLMQKGIGLFICCMDRNREQDEFENAYPKELRDHAKACGILGGEFIFEHMNFLEKAIIKKIAKTDKSISQINYAAIDAFVEDLQR